MRVISKAIDEAGHVSGSSVQRGAGARAVELSAQLFNEQLPVLFWFCALTN
jgi:hypothetical protein